MTSLATVMSNSLSRGTPVELAAEADDDLAQGAVADVDDPRPGDREGVDVERVAVVEVVVEEARGEVVRGADGVDVAGEVEVEVLHGDDLAVAAAGGAALDAEDRAQRGLADARGRAGRCGRAPCARPTVVVVLPSPSGVGVMAVTSTYLPRGFSRSTRSRPSSVTLALVEP